MTETPTMGCHCKFFLHFFIAEQFYSDAGISGWDILAPSCMRPSWDGNMLVVNVFEQTMRGRCGRGFGLDALMVWMAEASRYDCLGFPVLLAVRDFGHV
jgi:hypothetical protein